MLRHQLITKGLRRCYSASAISNKNFDLVVVGGGIVNNNSRLYNICQFNINNRYCWCRKCQRDSHATSKSQNCNC